MTVELNPHVLLPEPLLAFHPDRSSDVDIQPLRGLLRLGPYSRNLVPAPIRVATIAPSGDEKKLYAFMKELSRPATAHERKDYLPNWPGFQTVFGLHVSAAQSHCHLQLEQSIEAEIDSSPNPHIVLADKLTHAFQSLEHRRSDFDVAFVYLPSRWQACFAGTDDDFDLHDYLKAISAGRRIPLQVVREDSALAYQDRASVMWRVGLALYTKAGGVPWKLANSDPETAFIGISYALKATGAKGSNFVTCCSQVFDADGAGLEFIAYDAREVEVYRHNPFLSRTEMFRVMTRAVDLYRRRHAGKTPRRIAVHKTTEFKQAEIQGCMEAFHLCETVDLIQIVEDVPWRGVRIDAVIGEPKGQPTAYPVQRGSLIGLGPRDALLWTHGSVNGISNKADYFQGGKGTPKPLRLVRHAGHGPWDDTASGILGLTKMDWNNDALYDRLPVTLEYAKTLARVIKRMSSLGSSPYPFRFFM